MLRRQDVYSSALRARFRGVVHRDGVLIEGPAGWGEFSPFWDYSDEECVPWWRAAVEAADVGWPTPVRDAVPVNVTVPAVDGPRAHLIVTNSQGCTTAKVKVAEPGQSLTAEVERLEAVRDALGPTGKIRIDANGAWDVDTALARLTVLDRAAGGLEYVEQPVRTVPELAAVRRRQQVPVAADESIRRSQDPLAVIRAEAADIVVLKVQPLGGVRACLALAEQVGVPVVVSSALESSVGIAAGVALAAALPDLPHACGLATVQLFDRDVTDDSLVPVAGQLPVRRPEVQPQAPLWPRASDDVAQRWRERADRVARLAEQARGSL